MDQRKISRRGIRIVHLFPAVDKSLLSGGDPFFLFDALFYAGDLLIKLSDRLIERERRRGCFETVRQLGTRGEPHLVVGLDVEFDFLACEGADSVVAVSSSAGSV